MRVPVSATATAGAQNISASASSSVFGALAGAATAKKGQLPAFADILAAQSVDEDAGKNAVAASSTAEGGAEALLEAASSETSHAVAGSLLTPPFQQLKSSQSAQNNVQPGGSVSARRETKTTRHRTTSESPSDGSIKKQKAGVADLSPASAAAAPAHPIVAQSASPVVPAKWPRTLLGSSQPQNLAASGGHFSEAQSQEEESRIQVPVTKSSEVSTFGEIPLPADPGEHDLQARPIESAKEQHASPEVSEEAQASVSTTHNLLPTRQLPLGTEIPLSNSVDGVNNAALSPAGSLTQSAAASMSKPKVQEKAVGDAVHSPAAPTAEFASSMEVLRPHGIAPAVASLARADNPAEWSPKQGASIPDTNAFQRLDAGEAPPTLLHSSAHQIAIGVHDPSLGWLEVQTQSSAGHISATLTAASTEAHASLAAQAPAITQYLADRNVPVQSVNVHAQAEMQGGASGGGQSQSGPGSPGHEMPELKGAAIEERRQPSLNGLADVNAPQASNASYISVRA